MNAHTPDAGVVIVGSGAGGLACALALADAGVRSTIVTAGDLGDGASAWAQGGLAAVWGDGDTAAAHVADTLAAGDGLCDPAVVAGLAHEAPEAIARLLSLGARFDRDAAGLSLGLEGGHSARRIIHAGGATGAEVCRVLTRAVCAEIDFGRVRLRAGAPVRDLLRDADGVVRGVVLADGARVTGRAVVLATGGSGGLWSATTNPTSARGSGVALALRAGAVVRGLEFQQWHPTALAIDTRGPLPLISEAVRGEGAVIVDAQGRVLVDPLATRDVVSAAMTHTMLETGTDHVFLDARGLGEQVWEQRFATILDVCRSHGIDPLTSLIPVRPAAHSSCGGVVADLDGVTSVEGLFAVGEVSATGVHGANRLASNGLTEALVAGRRAALLLADSALTGSRTEAAGEVTACGEHAAYAAGAMDATTRAGEVSRQRMAAAMTALAGPLRDASGLTELINNVAAEPDSPEQVLSSIVARAALMRAETRGSHRRSDSPTVDNTWARHIDWRLGDDGPVATLSPLLSRTPERVA